MGLLRKRRRRKKKKDPYLKAKKIKRNNKDTFKKMVSDYRDTLGPVSAVVTPDEFVDGLAEWFDKKGNKKRAEFVRNNKGTMGKYVWKNFIHGKGTSTLTKL